IWSTAFQNAANRAYREAGVTAFTKREDWTDEEKREAWDWWAVRTLTGAHSSKFILPANWESGQLSRLRKGERRTGDWWDFYWIANREKPPHVQQAVTVYKSLPWTPDFDQLDQRQVAGMQYLQRAPR